MPKGVQGCPRVPKAGAAAHLPRAPLQWFDFRPFLRSRFVDQVPQAVEWLEYDPSGSRLAVLRANADIEIWSTAGNGCWYQQLHIAGVVDTPVRRLAFVGRSVEHPDGRLFSCGLHGIVTEWDLRRLSPRASWDSHGAQPCSRTAGSPKTSVSAETSPKCNRKNVNVVSFHVTS